MVISRAVLSVSDKTGLIPLAKFLTGRGVEILSTGGTAKHLSEAGIPVLPISKYTGAPEILGGRVKTLNPKVFGGILFDRDKADHRSDCEQNAIGPIDLVVVNLYPFEATVAREGVALAEAIEQIDVGGPSMLRAAAKNHRHVVPLCSPSLYQGFMDELAKGEISEKFRLQAAVETFRLTSKYDEAITKYLSSAAAGDEKAVMASTLTLTLDQVQPLRYGENPQQQAAFYRERSAAASFHQLQGKELSYNNLLDLDAAWKVANAFSPP
ncbi:MAG TPA: bifunctional phosphoribosylaminoimidazolecarboxamide formyltransferase/IMP cyclohydrolase, partial [Gemmatimonadaceae bacterium]|nr:bifunctional phosphoribosylaminoimidazolecarboxamide formyltransferase/IMP cyclohydrolase [Gemmatimonadaceae bacterium]